LNALYQNFAVKIEKNSILNLRARAHMFDATLSATCGHCFPGQEEHLFDIMEAVYPVLYEFVHFHVQQTKALPQT
jgi:hypothetical protein